VTDEQRPEAEPVGSIAEEAAKLLGALQGWASGNPGEAASGAAGLVHDLNEHIATGGAECRYCPLCQVISAVRGTSPEVKQHLTTAATSLVHAATEFLATRAGQGGGARPGPVQKIDLDDAGDDTQWED
jgi:hypothetical protein